MLERDGPLPSLEEVLGRAKRKDGTGSAAGPDGPVADSAGDLATGSVVEPGDGPDLNLAYLLYILNRQLLYAEEAMVEPSYFWLRPDLILCPGHLLEWILEARRQENPLKDEEILDKLSWFVLPQGLDLEGVEQFSTTDNIWLYLARLDPAGANTYLENQDLIMAGRGKEALRRLPESQRFSHLRTRLIQTEKQDERKKQDLAPKKSKRDKGSGFFARLFKRGQAKPDFEEDITIPLNPKADLFRLAMISEGAPGTLEENEGLKAFILVDEFLIGRDRTICDLVLEEETVGRVHARISRHGSHYFMEDLGSSNGSAIDGKKLNKHQTYLLPDHCRLKFAELPFYFTVD